MDIRDIIEKAKHELKALQGEVGKNKVFEASHKYPGPDEAQKQYPGAVKRLLNLNKWTEESGIRAAFELYDKTGQRKKADKPAIGDHFKVILPGVPLENWMLITDIKTGIHAAAITAHPCANPQANEPETTAHFFVKETSATFRVEVNGNTIKASQTGLNEKINNHAEAGSRTIPNTLIAEAGWQGMQFIQWENLAAFWCGLKDANNT
jgi:hypothetical protein